MKFSTIKSLKQLCEHYPEYYSGSFEVYLPWKDFFDTEKQGHSLELVVKSISPARHAAVTVKRNLESLIRLLKYKF